MLEITAQLSHRCMCHTSFWLGKEITALYPMGNFILKIKSQCWTSSGWGPHSLMCSFLGTILHCPGHPGASCNLRDRFCRWRDRKPSSCPKLWAHFIPAALSSRGAFPFHSVLSYIVLPKFKNAIYFAAFCATVLQGSGGFGTELLPPALLGYFWILSDIWKENPVQNGNWRKALCPGRGSFQMGRQCLRLEAAREQEKLGWSGARAASQGICKQRQIFEGLFYIAKENKKVGSMAWDDIAGFLLILISGQNVAGF